MAYIQDYKFIRFVDGETPSSASFLEWFSNFKSGDVLFLFVGVVGSSNRFLETPSGWTIRHSYTNNFHTNYLFTFDVSSVHPQNPTLNVVDQLSSSWTVLCLLVRDVPESYTINKTDVSFVTSTQVNQKSENNRSLVLLVNCFGGNSTTTAYYDNNNLYSHIIKMTDKPSTTANKSCIYAMYDVVRNNTTKQAVFNTSIGSFRGTSYEIIIPFVEGKRTPVSVVSHPVSILRLVSSDFTTSRLYDVRTTLGSLPVANTTGRSYVFRYTDTSTDDRLAYFPHRDYTDSVLAGSVSPTNSPIVSGVVYDVNLDLSNSLFYCSVRRKSVSDVLSPSFYVQDDLGNWMFIQSKLPNSLLVDYKMMIVDFSTAVPTQRSVGDVNLSSIVKLGLCVVSSNCITTQNRGFFLGSCFLMQKQSMIELSVGSSVNINEVHQCINGPIMDDFSSVIGSSVLLYRHNIKFLFEDNGEKYLDFCSIISNSKQKTESGEPTASITIENSSNENLNISSVIVDSDNTNSIFSISGNISCSSLGIRNMEISEISDPMENLTFYDFFSFVLSSSVQFFVFKSCLDSSHCITLKDGSSVKNCKFYRFAEQYAFRIDQPGTYEISQNSYTGYSQIIYISAVSGTIQIMGPEVSYVSDGAIVEFVSEPVSVIASFVTPDSRVRLFNVSLGEELDNVFVTSNGYSYVIESSVLSGNILRLQVNHASYDPIVVSFVFSGNSIELFSEYVLDLIYQKNSINGELVEEFNLDGSNISIEINDLDNETSVQRMYSWYKYAITSEDGIRFISGAIEAYNSATYFINQDVADLKLKNVKSDAITIKDGVISRKDSSSFVSVDSGPIHILPEYVHVVEVETGSGLSEHQENTLNKIPKMITNLSAMM